MDIKEIIKKGLQKGNVGICYKCKITRENSEYVEVFIEEKKVCDVHYMNFDNLKEFISAALEELKKEDEYRNVHVISKKQEFHFHYPGFNSVQYCIVPVEISNSSNIQVKTGIVSEKYEKVSKSKVLDVISAYPDYEVYIRKGFAFRGNKEYKDDKLTHDQEEFKERMERLLNWAACSDVEIRDNEIHIKCFSCNDMY